MKRTNLYKIIGEFDNPLFNFKNKNVMLYTAESFKEAFEAAEIAGLRKVVKVIRVPFVGERENCPVIDINTRQYIN